MVKIQLRNRKRLHYKFSSSDNTRSLGDSAALQHQKPKIEEFGFGNRRDAKAIYNLNNSVTDVTRDPSFKIMTRAEQTRVEMRICVSTRCHVFGHLR